MASAVTRSIFHRRSVLRQYTLRRSRTALVVVLIAAVLSLMDGCAVARPGSAAYHRRGDEIMVAGQLFHTGAPVVLWTDPGGYDAYRVEKRFVPLDQSSWEGMQKEGKAPETPNRYGMRRQGLTEAQVEQFRGGGWELAALQGIVDQFVLHYDVCGTSRQCFRILHDVRGLSVHFMLDIDGTIYQTMDLKERAWHATTSNDRSVGVEIANIGAYSANETNPFDRWYARDDRGRTRITIPESMGDGGVRTPDFIGYPDRDDPVTGVIQGRTLSMYDLTPQQYDSLIKLTAALCGVLPRIECDYPRDERGDLVTAKLPDDELASYRGLLGHFHIQENKVDPGPALQWDRVINEARRLLGERPVPAGTP